MDITNNKQLFKNMIISVIAQGVSLLTSTLLMLLIPKILSIYNYSQYQSYALYIGYVGIILFGILDGIILRYSKYDYDKLDKNNMRFQFIAILIICIFWAVIMIFVAIMMKNRLIIFLGIGIVIKNIYTFCSYIFQLTNRIYNYALIVIVDRLIYALCIIVIVYFKLNKYEYIVCADLFSDLITIIACVVFDSKLYIGKIKNIMSCFKELLKNAKSGIKLMISNISNALIIGIAKVMIKSIWGAIIFAKVAFGFSVSGIIMSFVSAISVVLFPSFRRVETNSLKNNYKNIRFKLNIFLYFMLASYFPLSIFLNHYIPQYSESIIYLSFLFPINIFDAKNSLLINNYLKSFRKETYMFKVNICTFIISVLLFTLIAISNNRYFFLMLLILIVMIKSMILENKIAKICEIKLTKEHLLDGMMVVFFIVLTFIFNELLGFTIYITVCILFVSVIFLKKRKGANI